MTLLEVIKVDGRPRGLELRTGGGAVNTALAEYVTSMADDDDDLPPGIVLPPGIIQPSRTKEVLKVPDSEPRRLGLLVLHVQACMHVFSEMAKLLKLMHASPIGVAVKPSVFMTASGVVASPSTRKIQKELSCSWTRRPQWTTWS